MRKLAVAGMVAAGLVVGASGARAANGHADQVPTNVRGTMANSMNVCFAIIDVFTAADCSYAATRYPTRPPGGTGTEYSKWMGPAFSGSFYPPGSAADPRTNPNALTSFTTTPGDGKYAIPMTGTVTVDDQGTDDPADDRISAQWTFSAAVYNTLVGQNDRAAESWDQFIQTLPPTTVNHATPNADGGFDYVIGTRGRPTPVAGPMPGQAGTQNEGYTFPSEYANSDIVNLNQFWSPVGATDLPPDQRVGIERSKGFGNTNGTGGASLQPNVGGQTTGSWVNYACYDTAGDNDCTTSELMFGSNDPGGGTTSPPGFENLILVISTWSDGRVTTAQAYWTREWLIKGQGGPIGDDPANPAAWTTNNSWYGGRFEFSGCARSGGPVAVDDTSSVVEGAVDAPIQVLANDTESCDEPNTVTIQVQPTHGTAQVAADNQTVEYTPDAATGDYYDGPDSLTYRVTDNGGLYSQAEVAITVTKKVPVADNFFGTSANGSPVTVVALTPATIGSGTIAENTINPGVATNGNCTASGTELTFTPVAGAGNGAGGCDYTITDTDGDVSNVGNLAVDITNNSGGGGGGSSGPQLPSGGGSFDLLTLAGLLAAVPVLRRRRRA